MRTRVLGRTGLPVSEIGFGAWGIGGGAWAGGSDEESLRALHRALDLGVDFIDTAFDYGLGRSEQLVGRVVRERRQAVTVATKVRPKNLRWPARPDVPASECYPPEYVVTSAEASLGHLGLERIDILQLHSWHDAYLEQDGWRDALLALKRSGKVRFLGISVTEHDPETAIKAVASGLFDSVQVICNVFDQSPVGAFFLACAAHGVGVIVRVPLDEGGLTGDISPETTFPDGDFRNQYFRGERKREVFERCRALAGLLGDEAKTLPELALRFCLSHDAVSTVIPGMRRTATVEASVAVSDSRRLTPHLLGALRAHAWRRNFYT